MNRAMRVAWPALTILVAAAMLLVVLAAGGDAGRAALGTGRPVVRLVLGLASAALLGLLVAAAAEPLAARRGRLLDAAAVAAGIQTGATGTTAFLLYLSAAPALTSASFGPGLVTFLLELPVGRGWLTAAIAAAVVTAVVVGVRSRRGTVLAVVLAAVALVPVALQAPAAGDPLAVARTAAVSAWLRMLGVGVALGVLAVRAAAARRRPDGRRVAVAMLGGLVAVVGAASTALLREGGQRSTALLDAGLLLVACAVLLVAVLAARASRPAEPLLRVALLLMAAAAGVGALPALTDPANASVPARSTPAEILTGSPLPAPVGAAALLGTWRLDPLWLLVGGALLVGYGTLVARARRAGQDTPAWRTASWTAGVVLLVWLTGGGPAVYGGLVLAVLLAQRVALLLVVPLLLAGGAPLALLRRAAGTGIRRTSLARLLEPRLAVVLGVLLLLVLVATDALRWTLVDPLGAELAVLLCLAAGVLLVGALLRPAVPPRTAVIAAAVLLLLETGAAVALATGSGLLQADWYGAIGWGSDALAAQRAAGVVGWAVAAPPTLVLLAAAARRGRLRTPATAPTTSLRPDGVGA